MVGMFGKAKPLIGIITVACIFDGYHKLIRTDRFLEGMYNS